MNKTITAVILLLIALPALPGCGPTKNENDQKSTPPTESTESTTKTNIIQYGSMREAIGEQKHQGRVRFADLVKQPNFYGVAALAGLEGEAAIADGELTVSIVDDQGHLESVVENADQLQATMLVGRYVTQWHNLPVKRNVPGDEFDAFLAESAASVGLNPDTPFIFTLEGEFSDLHLHVINGACPVHARMQKQDLPAEKKAFEMSEPEISGTLVGIYARDAVGKLTPGKKIKLRWQKESRTVMHDSERMASRENSVVVCTLNHAAGVIAV